MSQEKYLNLPRQRNFSGIRKLMEKIKNHKPALGTHVKWSNSNIVEILAMSGFDYIWIDCEHGILDLEAAANHIRAIQGCGAAAWLRVPWNDPIRVKPILEMGVDAIVFPDVRNAREAELAVASCRYQPQGIRGFGPGRSNSYGFTPLAEYLEYSKDIWKVIQIEHIEGVHNFDEIIEVEGISAVVVGQFDLSASMGHIAEITHPDVRAQLDAATEKRSRAGIPFGTSMGFDAAVVEYWFHRGASFISLGGDQDFLVEGARWTITGTLEIFDRTSGSGREESGK